VCIQQLYLLFFFRFELCLLSNQDIAERCSDEEDIFFDLKVLKFCVDIHFSRAVIG